MANLRTLLLYALTGALLFPSAALAQKAAPSVRIVNQIDESRLVTLKGAVNPLANPMNDRGLAPDSLPLDRMHLYLKRSASQEAALHELIGEMNTPGSANYHKWLTPDQFGKQFGPSDQDIATVETWLTGHGFNVLKVNPGNQTIEFSGNVAQLRSAFHTQIHKYVVNGEMHYANATDPRIPAALAPVVGGFVSLNNFRPRSYAQKLGTATYNPATGTATPQWTWGTTNNGVNFVLSPQDYAVQYNLNPLYNAGINGSGQTIAIVNEANINIGLVNQFRSLFSLPFNPPQVIVDGADPGVDGINNPDGPNYASIEAYLDVEWAGAVAPNATVDLVIAADTAIQNGLILALEHAIYNDVAPVVSMSFGLCEFDLGSANQFVNSLYEQAAAQGITLLVSTGDNGSAACDSSNASYATNGQAVNGLASTPYNVAVGGTDFYYSDYSNSSALDTQLATYWNTSPSQLPAVSLKAVVPEQAWNDSQYGLDAVSYYTKVSGSTNTTIAGGSGGASNCATGSGSSSSGGWGTCTAGYAKPSWQTGTGVPADKVRDLPDVSLFAADGLNYSYYPVCSSDADCQSPSGTNLVQISGVGGTSASAPSFAGIMALVNQKYGRQGQANTILYRLAAQFPAAFHDVTAGTNSVPCQTGTTDCISVTNPITIQVSGSTGTTSVTEGQIGSGATPEYNAGVGYDLATGLGSVDANVLVTNWGNVHLAGTTATMSATPTTITHGQAVSITGSVSTGTSTPTGNVALMTDSTEPGLQGITTFTLDASGNYTGSVTTLPGGTYNIWGQYGGDSSNAMSTSSKTQITVSPENSGIYFNAVQPGGTLTAGQTATTAIDYGTQMLLSAQVAPSSKLSALESCSSQGSTTTCPTFTPPTGTIAFADKGTALNTAVLNAEGDAEYNAPFAVGSHSVTASYAGDKSYNPAAATSPIAFTVAKDTPQIFVGASNQTSNQSVFEVIGGAGQPTVFNVILENGAQYNANSNSSSGAVYPVPVAPPTGTISITGFPSGVPTSATLSPGVDSYDGAQAGIATITIPANTPANSYNVVITYQGDANYTSTNVSGTVQISATSGLQSTTAATMSGSISPTTTIAITGTVTGQSGHSAPTGSVILFSSGSSITSVNLTAPSSGDVSTFSMTLNSQTLFQGSNFVTLQYTGDTTYAPSAFTLNSGGPIANPLSDFTMVPQTTIVPVKANSSGTVTIDLASVNSFSGTVNLSCAPDPGVECTISPTAGLSSGGGTTATLTVNAGQYTANQSYNVKVTGTDAATGKYIHTLGVEAQVTGSVAGSQSFALTNSGNISIDAGATTGNTSTITVTPLGGFTGTVGLTYSVTGPAGAASPTVSFAPTSVSLTGSAALTSTLTVATTASTTPGVYTVTVTGTSGAIAPTTTVTVNVGTPSFALSNSGNITVTKGATTGNTSTITVTPSNGFMGTVNLSCVVAGPAGANAPATCSLSPTSVSISGSTAQTATLTIATTAATAMNEPEKLFWPSTGGAVLALVFLFGIPKRRRNWLAMIGLLVFFVSLAATGCGGGGGGGNNGGGTSNPGTTSGTYTVTVTGASTNISKTTAVTVTVQ